MRKLITRDVPAFCRCMKRIGIKDEVRRISEDANTTAEAFSRGFDLVWSIFDLATEKNGEAALYEFLAGPFELSPDELAGMPIDEFFAGCKQLAEENNLTGFFKSAAALTK